MKHKGRKLLLKTLLAQTTSATQEKIFCSLRIYLRSTTQELYFHGFDLLNHLIYDAIIKLPENVTSQSSQSDYIQQSREYAESLVEQIYIQGHMLMFKSLNVKNGQKGKSKDKSQESNVSPLLNITNLYSTLINQVSLLFYRMKIRKIKNILKQTRVIIIMSKIIKTVTPALKLATKMVIKRKKCWIHLTW